jgi:hypothetical protein
MQPEECFGRPEQSLANQSQPLGNFSFFRVISARGIEDGKILPGDRRVFRETRERFTTKSREKAEDGF